MLTFSKKDNQKGFTLIELLVVIAIIGTLSSVVLASLNTAREKARDAHRQSTLKELEKALAIYHLEHNKYPNTSGWYGDSSCTAGWFTDRNSTNWIPGLVSGGYINSLPDDSKESGCNTYIYNSNGTDYKLMAHYLRESGSLTKGEPMARCSSGCTASACVPQPSMAVYSSGAACW